MMNIYDIHNVSGTPIKVFVFLSADDLFKYDCGHIKENVEREIGKEGVSLDVLRAFRHLGDSSDSYAFGGCRECNKKLECAEIMKEYVQ